jgi:hypothetical protein
MRRRCRESQPLNMDRCSHSPATRTAKWSFQPGRDPTGTWLSGWILVHQPPVRPRLDTSEGQAKAHLHDAGFAGGVDLAGPRSAYVAARSAEIGMVKGIEHLPAILNLPALGDA